MSKGRILGAPLMLAGVLCLVFPEQLVVRAYLLAQTPADSLWLIYATGAALLALGFAAFVEQQDEAAAASPLQVLTLTALALVYFIFLGLHLQAWWIDDAGITFAYSRSLSEGLGLVAQPWLPPEEGYSSSIWMLSLAGAARLGADIPLAAKVMGTSFSALTMVICAWILLRRKASGFAHLLCAFGIACAPTVVWAVSGQEHALQALLLLTVVFLVWFSEHWRWPVAVVLAVFVLTRPEAPLLVIGVFLAAVWLTRQSGGRLINAADAAVALLPFVTNVALVLFRLAYFGDPMPNPFYAKSSGTGLTGLFNPLGGGWAYILAGLRDTALLLVLGLIFLLPGKRQQPWIVIGLAILISHAVFVVWAKGDWMGQYRFLMPVVPVAMLLAGSGLAAVPAGWKRLSFGLVAGLVLMHTSVLQLADFKTRATTPLAVVTDVGNSFRALADRLEIEDPLLAHHDAGGIAYYRMIRLLDLGGLINRTIGKNMQDSAFMIRFVVEEMAPDFVFGAVNFAATNGFTRSAAFQEAYVPLRFEGLPHMQSDLSYIRRSRVKEAPGIEPAYDAAGTLTGITVDPSAAGG